MRAACPAQVPTHCPKMPLEALLSKQPYNKLQCAARAAVPKLEHRPVLTGSCLPYLPCVQIDVESLWGKPDIEPNTKGVSMIVSWQFYTLDKALWPLVSQV